jgi:hypothetical protein
MSKISLSPDVAGTGIFTIASPNSNTNRTLTLPDDTGTIVTNSGNQAGSFTSLSTSGAVVFNDAGADVDFRVEGDTDSNLLFVDASTDRVGIGTSSPAVKLDFGITTNGTQIVNLRKNSNSIAGLGVNAEYGVRIAGPSDADAPVSFGEISVSDGTTFSEFMRIDTVGDLIIGDTATSATAEKVSIRNNSGPALILRSTGDPTMRFYNTTDNSSTSCQLNYYSGTAFSIETIPAIPIVFLTTNTERMRITSGGELLVGKTVVDLNTEGNRIGNGFINITRDGGQCLACNRLTDDGNLVEFYQAWC